MRRARYRRPPLARQGKLGHLSLFRHPGLAQASEDRGFVQCPEETSLSRQSSIGVSLAY